MLRISAKEAKHDGQLHFQHLEQKTHANLIKEICFEEAPCCSMPEQARYQAKNPSTLSWNDILSLFSELILNLSDAQPILLPRLTITQASNSTRTLVWIILNHSYGREFRDSAAAIYYVSNTLKYSS